MLKGEDGQAYNVATDVEIKVKELAELLVNEVFPELNLQVVMKNDDTRQFLRVEFDRTADLNARSKATVKDLT